MQSGSIADLKTPNAFIQRPPTGHPVDFALRRIRGGWCSDPIRLFLTRQSDRFPTFKMVVQGTASCQISVARALGRSNRVYNHTACPLGASCAAGRREVMWKKERGRRSTLPQPGNPGAGGGPTSPTSESGCGPSRPRWWSEGRNDVRRLRWRRNHQYQPHPSIQLC